MASTAFVHLRVHSAYSLLEGALQPGAIAGLCRQFGMPAVAVTDTDNLFGVYEITDALAKAGIQPIVGLTLSIQPEQASAPRGPGGGPERMPKLALLAKDPVGYGNLLKIISRTYLETAPGSALGAPISRVLDLSDGLICLTGGPDGIVNRLLLAGQMPAAQSLVARLHESFGDRLYVELQRHGLASENEAEAALLTLAYAQNLPIVATNQAYFATLENHAAHDALLCIADGTYVVEESRRKVTAEHAFKSPEAMAALFADLPEALSNTIEIARRCAVRPPERKPILPGYVTPSGRSMDEELRDVAAEGLRRRLSAGKRYADEDVYRKRLEFELGVIIRMGFAGYFLIVSDFMRWTRSRGIPVGVRGSGATSIVAWCLDITSLDPIRFDLVFERFLNPERVSMPDFDIDFCQDRRDEVIRYVQEKYGADRVAQIITFGTLAARAGVRDIGRVFGMPFGQLDRISKLIPNQPGKQVSLKEAIAGEPRLQMEAEKDESVRRLFDTVQQVEGLYRHASTHAAGLVIGDRPLEELVALYRDPRSEMPVTQFDFMDCEKAGLVKFDFLGLKTLTVIAETESLLARRGIHVKAEEQEFDDARSFEMLARGDSVGVFQLESAGMRDLLRKLKPDRIEDLIALVALYRPGPMDSIPKYIACKHGREAPEYAHPAMEPLLRETFGVMTYQEDVMRIARELAGYTLGEADLLRRAMGKKIPEEMAKQKERFVSGASRNGIPEAVAAQIFDQAAKFAGYGFNKGHAAAYAQVAYQTAWLKANYPVEFLCASMTLDMAATDRLNVFRQEAARLGIPVLPPCVNRSEADFAPDWTEGQGRILYALGAVRNVGRQAMEHLVAIRRDGGPFRSLYDFARRVDPKVLNRRALENLARAGAFDALNPNRAQVVAAADLILTYANGSARDRGAGQSSLFGNSEMLAEPPLPDVPDLSSLDRLAAEYEAIGFYLSGHPLDGYRRELARADVVPIAELQADTRRQTRIVRLAGTIVRRQDRKSQRGTPFAYVSLSDPSGMFEVVVFSETLAQCRDVIEPGRSVVITAAAEWDEQELKLRANGVRSLDEVAAESGMGLKVLVQDERALPQIAALLKPGGRGDVALSLMLGAGREVDLDLPGRYAVTPPVAASIKALRGVAAVDER